MEYLTVKEIAEKWGSQKGDFKRCVKKEWLRGVKDLGDHGQFQRMR